MNVAGGGIDYDIGSNRSISSLESAVLDQKMDDIMGLLRHGGGGGGGGNVDGRDSLTHQAAHRTRGSFVQQERAKPVYTVPSTLLSLYQIAVEVSAKSTDCRCDCVSE
jgi:hypothetical protein